MKLFKRKKEVEVDPRTDIEKNFEEKGQVIGRKTGKLVQKSVDKIHEVKERLEEKGTMDKLRNFSDKVDDKVDKVVDTVAKKGKQIATKVQQKKAPSNDEDKDLFYE